MDRLFTVAYLPVCLLLLGLAIKFNSIPGRPRILTSFAAFTLIMLALPLVGVLPRCNCYQSVILTEARQRCQASTCNCLQALGLRARLHVYSMRVVVWFAALCPSSLGATTTPKEP
jgi:hypothetical protein